MTNPVTRPQHNPGCLKQYGLILDRVTKRAFFLPCFRGRWDCPACAMEKLGKNMQHLATRHSTLCWGPYDRAKRTLAQRKSLGTMMITYKDDVRIMVAESRLYTPQLPALTTIQQVIEHSVEREVSRIAWSDKWRPNREGDPERYDFISTDSTDIRRLKKQLEQAGIVDGSLGLMSVEVAKAKIEHIFNQVSFASSNSQ